MDKFLVIETYLEKEEQNYYWLCLPQVSENGFYRQATSFNGFFNSTSYRRPNVTEVRQFTYDFDRRHFLKGIDWDNLPVFETIHKFFEHIGYDYKTRKYRSGERMKIWDGEKFVLPNPRRKSQ